jgi:hypothetical protein
MVVRLLRDGAVRQRIESEARRLVVERYDWSAVATDFESALERVRRADAPVRQRANTDDFREPRAARSEETLVGSM